MGRSLFGHETERKTSHTSLLHPTRNVQKANIVQQEVIYDLLSDSSVRHYATSPFLPAKTAIRSVEVIKPFQGDASRQSIRDSVYELLVHYAAMWTTTCSNPAP